MIGEKHHNFTIIAFAESKSKHRRVLCRCDCGTEKIVRYDSLKDGKSKSCGCVRKESIANKMSERMIGVKFGLLTPILLNRVNYRGEFMWECKCDCGNTSEVKTSSLVNGNTKSCGCYKEVSRKKSVLHNKRFGLLVVIDIFGSSRNGGILWRCKCDCGKECFRDSSTLNGGGSVSCGCAKTRSHKEAPLSTDRFRVQSRILCNKRRSLKLNSVGSHSKEQLSELLVKQNHKCANCRVKIKSSYHADHIYPLSKGGSNDILNIQILCPSCNVRKSAIDPIVFAQKEGRLL